MSEAEKKEKISKAATDWAYHHSSAPDKETPDWIIHDFEAGAEFGYSLAQEEYKKQLKHEMEGIYSVLIGNGKIDPNQDELWIELLRTTMTLRKKSKTDETDKYLFDIEEAKKRYRITRVK